METVHQNEKGRVEADPVEAEEDVEELKQLIELHQNLTGSPRAGDILGRIKGKAPLFGMDKLREASASGWVCDPMKIMTTLDWKPAAPLDGRRATGASRGKDKPRARSGRAG